MKIEKENLSRLDQRNLAGLWLLDLDDELCVFPDAGSIGHNDSARCLIVGIVKPRLEAGLMLYQDLMAALGELSDAGWGHAHPIFVDLDFLGDADFHDGDRPGFNLMMTSQAAGTGMVIAKNVPESSLQARLVVERLGCPTLL